MPNLLPLIEDEAGNVYNKAALGTLRAGQDADNALAAQLAAGNGAPLTQNPFATALAGIKVPSKQAPMPTDLKVDLNKPISADLGDVIPNAGTTQFDAHLGDVIPNPDNTIKIPQQATPSAPASTGNVDPDVVSKWTQWYPGAGASAAAAGLGVAAGLGSSGGNPDAQAAKPTKSPDDDIPQDELDALDALVKRDGGNSSTGIGRKTASPASKNDDSEETAEQPSISPNKSTENIASVQKLIDMQQKAGQLQAILGGLRGVTDAVATASGKHENLFDKSLGAMQAQAGQLPVQYEQAVDFQKQDPKSAISETYRGLASKLGMPISEQTSASEIEKAFPQIVNIKTREDMVEARKEIAADRLEQAKDSNFYKQMALQDRATQRQAEQERKQEQQDVRRYDTYAAKLALPSSRTTLGQAQSQIYSVDRVDALLNGHANLNDLTPQEMVETAKGLDRVISGGASTIEGSKQLDPGTAKEWMAKQLQAITNQVHGANGGQFLARIQHNLHNEKNVAVKQAANLTQVLLSGSNDLAKRDPDRYQDFLQKANVHPDVATYLSTGQKPQTMFQQQQILQQGGMNHPNAPQNQGAGQASSQKTVVRKGYNAKTNQTQLIYDDGSKEVVDGRQ